MLETLKADIQPFLDVFGSNAYVQSLVVICAAFVLAMIIDRVIVSSAKKLAAKTSAELDNHIIELVHKPVFHSVILIGLAIALQLIDPGEHVTRVAGSLLTTIALIIWSLFIFKLLRLLLRKMAANPSRFSVLHAQTLPLFENLALVVMISIAIYYVFSAWHIDMTAWLASAGIVGIAVGFAAKDTLANLFSGVFILADAPYKIGDYVVLDSGERGEITHIGIRSTRMLTRDDVEVTVPNSVMGNTKIINESGGPHEKFRVRVQVGVAYGSDIDKVREVLMDIGVGAESVCDEPEPRVRMRAFGASSLDFELLCWVDQPVLRGRVLDALNCTVYRRFIEEGIEIPYAKQDVYIKEMPGSPSI
ncbi:MAG: mechanosensitive ion channel family protein [Pseudomonadota bacterium]